MRAYVRTTLMVAAALALCQAGCLETPEEGAPVDLGRYRWKNRVLLVFASSPDDEAAIEQRRKNDARESGFAERDLIQAFLYDTGDGTFGPEQVPPASAAETRQRLDVPSDAFALLLIGKDGGVKFRSDRPVEPQQIFDLIDAMPMRQQEMRHRQK